MALNELISGWERKTRQSRITFSSQKGIGGKVSRAMSGMRIAAENSDSRAFRIAAYGGIAGLATAYLAAGYASKAGEYTINTLTDFSILKALPLKAKTAIVAAATTAAAGGTMYVDEIASREPIHEPTRLEQMLPVESYRITEEDIKKNDVFYNLLETRFGYSVKDEKGNYVPLRTTQHTPGNPETYLEAFRRLNPDLNEKLWDREIKAKRSGDSIFHHLRPGDEIRFYLSDARQNKGTNKK